MRYRIHEWGPTLKVWLLSVGILRLIHISTRRNGRAQLVRRSADD